MMRVVFMCLPHWCGADRRGDRAALYRCWRNASRRGCAADLATLLAAIREDRDSWDLVEVSAMVLRRAEELIEQGPLATLDAIHLASATVFEASYGARLTFVTADLRQREAARHLALHVEWVA